MSGPFGSSQWMYSSGGFYPTEIEQSLRFNDDDSAYLSWTPASAGNRKTWTWSGWVKRGNITNVTMNLFNAYSGSGSASTFVQWLSDNTFRLQEWNGSSAVAEVRTSALYRDVSAWYHIVVKVDTTQATASNRIKIYVNGEEITSFTTSTYMSQNYDCYMNNNIVHTIGIEDHNNTGYFDGYLAEVNFIDGQALDATSFGEFKSGVWVANEYTGSYGTNGFYLNFSDSANIGDDLSGNANDWTANNLVATDVVLDSPTNNFAVLNAIYNSTSADCTLSEGNLRATGLSGNNSLRVSTFLITGGKWYVEAQSFGMPTSDGTSSFSAMEAVSEAGRFGWRPNGTTFGLTGSPTFASYQSTDVLGMAIDFDNTQVTFYKNNVVQGSGAYTWTSSAPEGLYVRAFLAANTSYNYYLNFGQDSSFAGNKTPQGNTDDNGVGDFYYAPPAGYLALCTANLPDPVIDPAQDDVPSDYFNTVLYTGTGSSQTITGVGFQPDLVWVKKRSTAGDHKLVDAVRGTGLVLESNTTDAEATESTNFTGFASDGFSLDNGAGAWNESPYSYTAWNWLAGNGTSSNTDGSITSTVSVNQKAGFSVVSYTGTGANATVGHGLGVAAKVVISKSRTNANGWPTLHAPSGNYGLRLNSTGANDAANGPFFFQDTAPTSSVFYVGANDENNTSGGDMIAYCFAEVEGYSKFGSYTGNGSTDGPFVYTGFRPAWVLIKASSRTGRWIIMDTERDPHNVSYRVLSPNFSNAEDTSTSYWLADFLSNGVKLRYGADTEFNQSAQTYIFMAFAENPFKYANAR